MKNLNFLAGRDMDWIERNFKPFNPYSDEVDKLQKNDVIVGRNGMRKYLKFNRGHFTFFTNFQFDQLQSEKKKKNIYYYDIYDVMFDDDGKIVGAIRNSNNNLGMPAIGQKRYPVKYSRTQYALNFRDYSIFIGDKPSLFMNWKENPFEVK